MTLRQRAVEKEKMLFTIVFSFFHNVIKAFIDKFNNFRTINFLTNYKILDWSKLKVPVLADDNLNVVQMIISIYQGRNIKGNGENDGYQHFLLLLQCFEKLFPKVIKNCT